MTISTFRRVGSRDTTPVRQSIIAALQPHECVVLAVSGGVDSMVLLDAAAAAVPRECLTVATFDHGTGAAASAARTLVERTAAALGIACVSGATSRRLTTEAELRDARWRFLRGVAARDRAADAGVVCTAHTADDQVETVLMRVLRSAGPRGLAGLYATSDIVRPFVRITRRQLLRYARAQGLAWIEDPSNESPRFLRNRLRHDLLPALRRADPTIDDALLSCARKAARWRSDVESYVAEHVQLRVLGDSAGLDARATSLSRLSNESLSILWPAIAARGGVTLDRRGTARLVEFTGLSRVGARMQLAGGWQVVRSRDAFQLRASGHRQLPEEALSLTGSVTWGPWSFRHISVDGGVDSWSACLPADRPLMVRRWRAGDTMACRSGMAARKVKHLLTEGGVTGHERTEWPVVLAGDQIVWIPGIRRTEATTARSGRPGLAFVCDYLNR